MPTNIRRPLKVVVHSAENYQAPVVHGGGAKIFDPGKVEEARARFRTVVLGLPSSYGARYAERENAAGVARVVLKKEARAKSHRPNALFNDTTCPIIGYESFGTLLISVTKQGAVALEARMQETSHCVTSAVSTIESIVPYSAIVDGDLENDFSKPFKLRLFKHDGGSVDIDVQKELYALTDELGLPRPQLLDYAKNLRVYSVFCRNKVQADSIASFYGTQSLTKFVEFSPYKSSGVAFVENANVSVPQVDEHAPIVGLLDSGVSEDVNGLSQWVAGRDDEDVPMVDRDYSHGTFIAGLLTAGRDLNDGFDGIPKERCRVFDAIVMPKSGTDERFLLASIKRVVRAHPEIRAWNLSANLRDRACCLESYSTFAMALDELMEQQRCVIVCSAGNYGNLRTVPPWQPTVDDDRISPPAENILGLAVGSVSHIESKSSVGKAGYPSPFTRRGPGSGYVQKPDVCHYGGNCDASGNPANVGVKSFYVDGRICYGCGTSYSAPLVTILMAHLLDNTEVRCNLAKGLLIHSAVRNTPRITPTNFCYMGYGIPGSLDGIVNCEEWSSTLIFETTLRYNARRYDHAYFPLPSCLVENGRFTGEITMTLVYDPLLDPNDGAEYCRTNVKASIGVRQDPNEDNEVGVDRVIEPLPRKVGGAYEADLIKNGQKWKAVKVYRKQCKAVKVGGDWGVRLEVSYRDDRERPAQDFALIVTIADIERSAPVYRTVENMLQANEHWQVRDLEIQARLESEVRNRQRM